MADLVPNANVIRCDRVGRIWWAILGPDAAGGLYGLGETPEEALAHLLTKLHRCEWCWDETWRSA